MQIDPHTPVIVGVSTITQRLDDPTQAKDTLELMVEAALGAEADSTASGILKKLNQIIAMGSMTPMANPSQLVAEKIGAEATTLLAEVGTLQQTVFDRASMAVVNQQAEAVLVISGETQYRALRSKITGSEISQPPADSGPPPDETLKPDADIIHPLEIEMGMHTAASHYAMLENAFGHAKGLSPLAQRQATAQLWERFNQVAGQNPKAAFPEPKLAEEIASPGPKNRPIAAPYNKWNCSQINVDQASAILFVSAGLAEDLNIPKEKWVFPCVGAVSNHMVPIVKRKELHRCQGFKIVGEHALEKFSGGMFSENTADITHLDLYSCFPVAVWIQSQEFGLNMDRQLTVTGGMTFGGGPLNSYVLGSLTRMVQTLRADGENGKSSVTGAVTSVSGMLSKQGIGIFSSTPPKNTDMFLEAMFLDLSQEVAEATPTCQVEADYVGPASVVSSTLLFDKKSGPEKAVCIADTPNGTRTIATTSDPEILTTLNGEDYLGRIIDAQIQIVQETGKTEFKIDSMS